MYLIPKYHQKMYLPYYSDLSFIASAFYTHPNSLHASETGAKAKMYFLILLAGGKQSESEPETFERGKSCQYHGNSKRRQVATKTLSDDQSIPTKRRLTEMLRDHLQWQESLMKQLRRKLFHRYCGQKFNMKMQN